MGDAASPTRIAIFLATTTVPTPLSTRAAAKPDGDEPLWYRRPHRELDVESNAIGEGLLRLRAHRLGPHARRRRVTAAVIKWPAYAQFRDGLATAGGVRGRRSARRLCDMLVRAFQMKAMMLD